MKSEKTKMLTALEKHRKTAQHSTNRRGQTSRCLVSVYNVRSTKETSAHALQVQTLPCIGADANIQLQQFSCPVCLCTKYKSSAKTHQDCFSVTVRCCVYSDASTLLGKQKEEKKKKKGGKKTDSKCRGRAPPGDFARTCGGLICL